MKSEFPVNKKPGMPRFEPTAEQRQTVETVAGYGSRTKTSLRLIISPWTKQPIDAKTLRVAFREEFDTAATKVNAAVVKSLYKNAVEHNNVAAQIWWTKARMRWSETVIQKDQDDVELTRMSDEELIKALEDQTNRLGVKIIWPMILVTASRTNERPATPNTASMAWTAEPCRCSGGSLTTPSREDHRPRRAGPAHLHRGNNAEKRHCRGDTQKPGFHDCRPSRPASAAAIKLPTSGR